MSRTRRVAVGGATTALTLGALATLVPTAAADPVNANSSIASVSCADGSAYQVTANDRSGQFSAAHDLGSTATLVPLAWGVAHVELRSLDDGSLIAAFDEDWGGTKGRSAHQPGAKECTVSIGGPEEIPDLGAVLVTVDIPVTLVVTPR
jgi:hypothetical protein